MDSPSLLNNVFVVVLWAGVNSLTRKPSCLLKQQQRILGYTFDWIQFIPQVTFSKVIGFCEVDNSVSVLDMQLLKVFSLISAEMNEALGCSHLVGRVD